MFVTTFPVGTCTKEYVYILSKTSYIRIVTLTTQYVTHVKVKMIYGSSNISPTWLNIKMSPYTLKSIGRISQLIIILRLKNLVELSTFYHVILKKIS